MSTHDIRALLNGLRERWMNCGIVTSKKTTGDSITNFQEKYNVLVPEDFCDYFLLIGGMESGEIDSEQIRFWPLDEVKPVVEELPEIDHDKYDGYFVFADYSMWAHAYAIKLSNSTNDINEISLVGGNEPIRVANSFSEFVYRYINDVESIFEAA